jgi:hypothetical protein
MTVNFTVLTGESRSRSFGKKNLKSIRSFDTGRSGNSSIEINDQSNGNSRGCRTSIPVPSFKWIVQTLLSVIIASTPDSLKA